MSREQLLRKIREKARIDRELRRDPRFLRTMGLLVAKGFLRTNLPIPLLPNQRLSLLDAIWAGQRVEPRILEVLPAAVLRLGRHFDFDPQKHPQFGAVLAALKKGESSGPDFYGIPYSKLKLWTELPLRDRRVRSIGTKKILKTFRLDPIALEKLKQRALSQKCTETEVLETLLKSLKDP